MKLPFHFTKQKPWKGEAKNPPTCKLRSRFSSTCNASLMAIKLFLSANGSSAKPIQRPCCGQNPPRPMLMQLCWISSLIWSCRAHAFSMRACRFFSSSIRKQPTKANKPERTLYFFQGEISFGCLFCTFFHWYDLVNHDPAFCELFLWISGLWWVFFLEKKKTVMSVGGNHFWGIFLIEPICFWVSFKGKFCLLYLLFWTVGALWCYDLLSVSFAIRHNLSTVHVSHKPFNYLDSCGWAPSWTNYKSKSYVLIKRTVLTLMISGVLLGEWFWMPNHFPLLFIFVEKPFCFAGHVRQTGHFVSTRNKRRYEIF